MKQFKRTGAALSVLVAALPLTVGAEEAVTPTSEVATTVASETPTATDVTTTAPVAEAPVAEAKEAKITAQNKDASNGTDLKFDVPFVAKVEIPTKDAKLTDGKLSVKLGKEFKFATETVTNTQTGATAEVSKIKVLHGDKVFREIDTSSLPKNEDGSLDFSLALTPEDAENGVVSIQFELIAPKGDTLTRKIEAELKAGDYTSKTELSIEFAGGSTASTETSGTETTAEAPTTNGEETTVATDASTETPSGDTTDANGNAKTDVKDANADADSSNASDKKSNSNTANEKRLPKTSTAALLGTTVAGLVGLAGTVFTRKRKGR